MWHLPEVNFTANAQDIYILDVRLKLTKSTYFKITVESQGAQIRNVVIQCYHSSTIKL